MKKLQKSGEDYLEAIYALSDDGNATVRSVDIANRLGVTKPSTSRALGILAEQGYIVKQAYGSVSITKQGIKKAKEVTTRHNALRTLLLEVFGVSPQTAEHDACLIEHTISEETTTKLLAFLEAHKYAKETLKKEQDQ